MKLAQIIQFLVLVSGLLDATTVGEIRNKNIGAKDATIYIRKQITAGNVTKLIDGTTERVVGITNIDGNKLDAYRNFIIEAISFKYGTDAAEVDPSKIDYTSAPPAALRNAELILMQGTRNVVSIPILSLLAGNNASPATVDGDRFKLMVWNVIREGLKFSLNIEFANGAALGGGNHFVEVNFFGAETYLKSQA